MNKLYAKERSLFSDIDYDVEPEETDAAIEDDYVFDDVDVEEEYQKMPRKPILTVDQKN